MPSRYRRPATPAERAHLAAAREQRLAVLHQLRGWSETRARFGSLLNPSVRYFA